MVFPAHELLFIHRIRCFCVILTAAVLGVFLAECSPNTHDPPIEVRFDSAGITEARIISSSYGTYNVVNLWVTTSAGVDFEANFLRFFDRTGGLDRWGYPISEVFEEELGLLVQYFDHGVLKFDLASGVEAGLVGDELFGDDQSETGIENEYDGPVIGPGERRVSNVSVDGSTTGFLDTFERLGGIDSFGAPRTEARPDNHPMALLAVDDQPDDVVRQYFEAAVLEHYTYTTEDTTIRPIGRELRERRYPDDEWLSITAFRPAAVLAKGEKYSLELLRHAGSPVLAGESDGVLVGRATHPYAIAYHPQQHLFYRENDGWYALYFDGENGVAAHSSDGTTFERPQVVTHVKTGPGMSIYSIDDRIYLLYSDVDKQSAYLRVGSAGDGRLDLGEPILVADRGARLLAYITNLAVAPDGTPWILIRSYQDTPTGAANYMWLTGATDASLRTWTDPVRLTTEGDAAASTFGSSGSLAFAGEDLVVVYNLADEIRSLAGDRNDPPGLLRARVGSFRGTHDYIIISAGDTVHLAYHADHPEGQMMTYQSYDEETGWSEPVDVGISETHATAMTVDATGNVWIFYSFSGEVKYRVWLLADYALSPETCAVRIDQLVRAGSPWLASAPSADNEVGLLWTERIADRWEVRFTTVTLDQTLAGTVCEEPATSP